MSKFNTARKRVSFTLNSYEYDTLARFADSEERKISSAAKMIVLKHLRKFYKKENGCP
ncbi:MAG: hypothetical protein FWD48_04330 [Oscillospiraceae bacterium]|nr:hypothetical protein [Oscillospiraceae bacterium]